MNVQQIEAWPSLPIGARGGLAIGLTRLRTQCVVSYLLRKVRHVAHLPNRVDLAMAKLYHQVHRQVCGQRVASVPLSQLKPVHPVNYHASRYQWQEQVAYLQKLQISDD